MPKQPPVGKCVQYVAKRTRGPRAAIVIAHKKSGALNLQVFMASGNMFPAFEVFTEPTTEVEHYWQYIPEED